MASKNSKKKTPRKVANNVRLPPPKLSQPRRSLTVPLIFIGTLGAAWYFFSSSEEEVVVQQNTYRSREDCQSDWGFDPQYCQLENDGRFSSAGWSYSGNDDRMRRFYDELIAKAQRYRGPRYFWQRADSGGYPVEVLPDGSTRPISGARISGGGTPSRAVGTSFSHGTISRGGFGSSSAHFSAGG